MRLGICAGINQAKTIADAGADYIELSVAGDLIPDDGDDAWKDKRAAIEAMPLKAEAFNSFVRTGKIVGPDADFARLESYARTAAARAAQVGGKIIVFGSGGARQVPEGYAREAADADLLRFLNLCADAYETTGVIVVIEPLAYAECNILNTVDEGADMARRVARPGVRGAGGHVSYGSERGIARFDSRRRRRSGARAHRRHEEIRARNRKL